MAVVSNVNRKASAKALVQQIAALRTIIGLSIQTHRAYESPSRGGAGRRQQDVSQAAGAGASTATISKLENGNNIPGDTALRAILRESGFNMTPQGGGTALFNILRTIRDSARNLHKIKDEKPA